MPWYINTVKASRGSRKRERVHAVRKTNNNDMVGNAHAHHSYFKEEKDMDKTSDKYYDNEDDRLVNTQDEYDKCYETGEYEDQYCQECPHRYECSGSEIDEEEDE